MDWFKFIQVIYLNVICIYKNNINNTNIGKLSMNKKKGINCVQIRIQIYVNIVFIIWKFQIGTYNIHNKSIIIIHIYYNEYI